MHCGVHLCILCNSSFWLRTSVLWHCWLGSRKGIWPVKNWVVRCWCGCLSGARCRLAYGSADATATHCLLLQWNQVGFTFLVLAHPGIVPEKGPINGCVCVCVVTDAHRHRATANTTLALCHRGRCSRITNCQSGWTLTCFCSRVTLTVGGPVNSNKPRG